MYDGLTGARPVADGLIAAGCGSFVMLYDPVLSRVAALLVGHTGRVNCVQWVSPTPHADESLLVSGSSDGRIILWRLPHVVCPSTRTVLYSIAATVVITPHASVTCLTTLTEGASLLIAAGATDSTLRVWRATGSSYACEALDVVHVGATGSVTSVAAMACEGGVTLLLAGAVDSALHIYNVVRHACTHVLKLTGHKDWVRVVAVMSSSRVVTGGGEGALCTWSITPTTAAATVQVDEVDVDDDDSVQVEEEEEDRYTRAHTFQVQGGGRFLVSCDALLRCHTGWVNAIAMQGGDGPEPRTFVTASGDATLAAWACATGEGVFKLGAGSVGHTGTVTAYMSVASSSSGARVAAVTGTGAWHVWGQSGSVVHVGGTGHSARVASAVWDAHGRFLVTCSSDASTRVWAPLHTGVHADMPTLVEVGRPQMHGYPCVAVALGASSGSLLCAADEKVLRLYGCTRMFLRTLMAVAGPSLATQGYDTRYVLESATPRPALAYVPELALTTISVGVDRLQEGVADRYRLDGRDAEPTAAPTAQPLNEYELPFADVCDAAVRSSVCDVASWAQHALCAPPPHDADLCVHGRWAETGKLYGHVCEVHVCSSVTVGHRVFAASAANARDETAATLRVWDVDTGATVALGVGHTLTVCALAWEAVGTPSRIVPLASHGAHVILWGDTQGERSADAPPIVHLLSAGKDRCVHVWRLHPGTSTSATTLTRIASLTHAHKRVIWTAHWAYASSVTSVLFATGSRDGTLKLWRFNQDAETGAHTCACAYTLTQPCGVTVARFAPLVVATAGGAHVHLLACAREDGHVSVHAVHVRGETVGMTCVWTLPPHAGHCDSVLDCAWRPPPPTASACVRTEGDVVQCALTLATAGADTSVRVLDLNLRMELSSLSADYHAAAGDAAAGC